ncbi:hypothetical protein K2173_004964 [Erythroxylum novogranatense]|uniref:Uncharacterized protein n=1 Tax=Erythroxylum novogranatense TaxID=1862640 RepID=A0AAV8TBN6_9ROSI|nr:hypothetical protein K2173_004964 [Erythroxylum novogranatense]
MDSQDPKLFHWQYAERKGNDFVMRGRSLFFLAVLIGVVLLVFLLVLYARWVCLYDIPRLPNNSSPPDRSQGLDQTTIKALPISLYRAYDTVSVENECCICLGVLADGDKVKVLPSLPRKQRPGFRIESTRTSHESQVEEEAYEEVEEEAQKDETEIQVVS